MGKKISAKNRAKRRRIGTLIGIPVLLFVSGITLLSLAFFDNISYAFYLSRMFFPQEVINSHEKVGQELQFSRS